ncbi:hypothetical protein JR316_0002675 [Psilocybe cubensis]|uniref:Uncharacterized protein n=1 Tax=Psilocybe cubensis TaxID=181762 RepID=A0ACB8HDG4_PSICU|nr:hypothetical protein JR316_0002675 [Psilocybe cubensis]KAH9485760.1 hypothetical protein JR316_0002675 [Psilocybe cubensis]
MPPTCIQDLALELVQEIVVRACQCWDDSLSKESLKQLRLVSWQFREAATTFLFSELKFNFSKRQMEDVLTQLDHIAQQKTEIRHCVRILVIESTNLQLSGSTSQGTYVNLLNHAIRSLLEVRSIRWTISALEGFYSVLEGIMDLPHVQELYFDFSKLPLRWQTPEMIPLRQFKSTQLQSFGFLARDANALLAQGLINQLQKIMPTASLSRLDIGFTDSESSKNAELMNQFFKALPKNTPLRIKYLRVHGWKLALNSLTMPHLRQMSFLDLSHGSEPFSQSQIWSSILNNGIQLRKIVGAITSSLNLYLQSYAGLEQITVIIPRPNSLDVLAFYHELCQNSLPIHASTLKYFKVVNTNTQGHCVLDDMNAISVCEKLEHLTVTIMAGHIDDLVSFYIKY